MELCIQIPLLMEIHQCSLNGHQVWLRSTTGSREFSDAGPPEIVREGIVFVGSVDGSVQAIQVNDGKLLWRYVIKK